MIKHNCCVEAIWLLKCDERQSGWYITVKGAYQAQVDFCPWCGAQLPIIINITKENATIVARWIDQHLGEKITYQETYLSLVGAGGLLEQLGKEK